MLSVSSFQPFKTQTGVTLQGTPIGAKMNIETEVMFTNIDKPELGILTWNQISTFTIYDKYMTEIDQFCVNGIDSMDKARAVAWDHFEEIGNEQDY